MSRLSESQEQGEALRRGPVATAAFALKPLVGNNICSGKLRLGITPSSIPGDENASEPTDIPCAVKTIPTQGAPGSERIPYHAETGEPEEISIHIKVTYGKKKDERISDVDGPLPSAITHILPLLHSTQHQGQHHLHLPLCSYTLTDFLPDIMALRKCTEKKAIYEHVLFNIVQAITGALVHLEKVGCVHGDIKPDNFLQRHKDKPSFVLADFGIARWEADFKEGAQVCGTPFYMAPEEINSCYEFSPTLRDVYSAGKMLLRVLGSDFTTEYPNGPVPDWYVSQSEKFDLETERLSNPQELRKAQEGRNNWCFSRIMFNGFSLESRIRSMATCMSQIHPALRLGTTIMECYVEAMRQSLPQLSESQARELEAFYRAPSQTVVAARSTQMPTMAVASAASPGLFSPAKLKYGIRRKPSAAAASEAPPALHQTQRPQPGL
jgi:serine/threonine protein kinase